MAMSVEEGMEFLTIALEKYQDGQLWDMWLVRYGEMTSDNFVSFDQFKVLARSNSATKRTEEEIIQDAENIMKSTQQ